MDKELRLTTAKLRIEVARNSIFKDSRIFIYPLVLGE